MSEELKPCPFCGGDNLAIGHVESGGVDVGIWGVDCADCDIGGAIRDTETEARAAWNSRPIEDDLRVRGERCRVCGCAMEREVIRLSNQLYAELEGKIVAETYRCRRCEEVADLRAEVEQLRAFRDSVPWSAIKECAYACEERGLRVGATGQVLAWVFSPTPPANQA